MTYFHDTAANARALAGFLPHMPVITARAWLHCEGQSIDNPTNPLNIRYTGGWGQTGKNRAGFAVYPSTRIGLEAAARLILRLRYYTGVRLALATGDGLKIARAIEESPWAAGHYGGEGSRDGCIARYVKAHPAPAPTPPVDNWQVRAGLENVRLRASASTTGKIVATVDAPYDAHATVVPGGAYVVNGHRYTSWLRITAKDGHTVTPRYSAAAFWQRKQ